MKFIPLSARTVPFTPKSLKQRFEDAGQKAPVITLRVPTQVEREQLTSRLMSMGLRPVDQNTTRAVLITELYEHADEATADETANFLDGYWQRLGIYDLAVEKWTEQEAQRILDQASGAPARPPAVMPEATVKPREKARVALIFDDMMQKSRRMREITSQAVDYGRMNAMLLVQLGVVKATGIPDLKLTADKDGMLTEESVIALREVLHSPEWNELVGEIDTSYVLTRDEEKNSGSPAGNQSDQTGSPRPTGDQGSNGGASTSSNSEQTRAPESGTITGKSSTGSGGSKGRSPKHSRTGLASSTSLSG